jgi:glycosyltransferase involved in cell wall biosynthesis
LHRASARTYVNRSAGLEVFLTASYCRFNRRNFIYSSSSTFDFTGEYLSHSRRDTFLFNAGLRMADAVVVQTRDQERLARHRGVRSLVMAIPSFVEPGTVNSHREHLLWVGNSYYYKQPKAFVELARQVPHARCVMVLTERTSPPDAIRAAEIVQEAEQIANLTVRSAMPRDEVLELIGRSVAVVNTSIGEGMPNIFLEAWARGVPALSLAVDPDTLIQTEGLGIAANGDWTRFVQGARSLWDDGSGALAAGRRGRELVRDRHDPERVAEQWTEVAEAVQAPDRA